MSEKPSDRSGPPSIGAPPSVPPPPLGTLLRSRQALRPRDENRGEARDNRRERDRQDPPVRLHGAYHRWIHVQVRDLKFDITVFTLNFTHF
ncbi:hypothetical protein NHX12_001983 [Muraenolepis orangiensis]|uniref:Uncharacterized protein n=1 Tax=Muraenolepis orangiensis TaxID=630683 RepID=A0A9Q0E3K4_9TELE|nr:hypothetical protein NHX12_001983 [Muraenolepis orangiensis]